MESKSRTQVSSTGYLCFSDFSSTTTAIPQQLDQELFNLQSGMELLDFPSSKNLQQTVYNSDSVTLPKSHHGPYQHEFYQNPRIHVFTGGYSDLATHSIFPSSSSFQTQQLKNSKFLEPAKELLNEFCNIGTVQTSNTSTKLMIPKISKWEGSSSSEGTNQSLYSIDLQKRKVKLVSMLEEVDRRYKHYCEQTRLVVSSFESVAGNGTTNVYLGLASKAMSKHFRCLRDGIVGQIQALREKESVAPGMTRGETPRLKVLDQALRKQIAFQQMGAIETHPWRPQRGLPERSVSVLRAWLFEHFLHPYPSDVDKHILARQTGLSRSQVSNWFINARVRLWKPMVEEMYMQETKAHDKDLENPNPNSQTVTAERPSPDYYYKKPTSQDLSESLASIINSETGSARNGKNQQEEQLDFSSYKHAASTVTYSNDDSCNHYLNMGNSGRGGVSLTLGLQHSGGGVSHSFSPVAHHSMFLTREQHMEEFGFLDAEETQGSSGFGSQGLPYRNMAGGQLLHHFVG